ncbi:MAG: hypothetical protein INR70_13750 [Parafilimonas terrae]|jgi:hypothetical protein|nr:hypothetical protein [Parafilimonas terrae]
MTTSPLPFGCLERTPMPPRPAEAGLLRRLMEGFAAALAAPVLALVAGVPLRSAHRLIPDGDE